ncbi:MAG: Nucleoside kinase [Candidatus Woesearchaeota archaeon]|nr:Nucleoside kinase [Candidatus Woesearchaeota archaeon]
MYDIITVGSATVDVFIDTDSELITIKTHTREEELIAYPAGEKLLIKHIKFMTGGGGTNTAFAFSKLGHNVGYLGKIGKDDGGRRIEKLLKQNKIKFLGVIADGMTSYSVILDSIEHDRTILTYKGVMDTFEFKEINTKKLKTNWFYFSALVEKSYDVLERLAEFAQNKDINIVFNPSSYLAKKGSKYLEKVLKNTHVLILNKEEAEMVVGSGSIQDLLEKIRETGPEIAVITDGKKGAYCSDGRQKLYIKAHGVEVVEATGAGDAFASGFTSGLIRKKDLKFCLQLGLANAESVIGQKGAKSNLLSYRSACYRIRKNPAKISNL